MTSAPQPGRELANPDRSSVSGDPFGSRPVPALSDDRGQLLEEVTRALNDAGDFQSAVRAGARCSVPRFADLVIVVVRRDRPCARPQGEQAAREGHRVLEAHDGDETLSMVQQFSPEPDLVLSDAIVPGIGTAELEARVHELRPDLPVLFMSGYSRDEMVERSLIHPEQPFLQKPFTPAELSDVFVGSWNGGQRPVVER